MQLEWAPGAQIEPCGCQNTSLQVLDDGDVGDQLLQADRREIDLDETRVVIDITTRCLRATLDSCSALDDRL
jgi:hypothetical protein